MDVPSKQPPTAAPSSSQSLAFSFALRPTAASSNVQRGRRELRDQCVLPDVDLLNQCYLRPRRFLRSAKYPLRFSGAGDLPQRRVDVPNAATATSAVRRNPTPIAAATCIP